MNRVTYACLLVLAAAMFARPASAQLASSTWPKFHHDAANSGQGAYGGPGSELSWTYSAPGAISSGPVLGADGSVYFACDDGNLYALTGGGSLLWTVRCNCLGASSPAVGSDGAIYVGSSDPYVYAINANGTQKWRRSIAARVTSSINISSSGTLYFGCSNGTVYAFGTDGTQKWTYSVGGSVVSTPAVASDGTVYVGSQNGGVYALSSAGALKWKFTPAEGGGFAASPAIGSDGTVYIGSSFGYFYALRSTGTQKWRVSAGGEVVSSAAVTSGGTIFYGCRDGKLHAISTTTGSQQWVYSAGSYIDSSPAAGSDGGVCFASTDGTIYSLGSGGALRWQYDTGSSVYSSPAVGPAGALFVGAANGALYCFAADDTPPTAPTVTDDGVFTCLTDRIHGSWSASDPDSGVYAYEYCVGTAPGLSDVAGWLSAGSATQQTRTGLVLLDKHTYYITVRATNGAGLVGPSAASDGITVDASAPTTPAVTDDGQYTTNASSIHASWTSSDPESGIVKYYYSIGTTPGATNVIDWTDAALSTSVTRTGLSLANGSAYYVNVKALSGAGAYSAVGSTDGIIVDATPPNAPAVTDDGQFISTPTSIHVTWAASDNESGIVGYDYSVGTAIGSTNVKGWTSAGIATEATITGLSMTNGSTYYVNVRASNGAGLVSAAGSTNGAILDTTRPSTPVVTDDGLFTASTTGLHASWASADAESGIRSYRYAVGTTAGGADVLGWTDVATATSADISGLGLAHNQIYYISVIATNGALGDSLVGSSDGIRVDATAPTTPVVTDDGVSQANRESLHATWSSADAESGIDKFSYCMGTSAGQQNVVAWTDVGLATSVTRTGLNLAEASRYYISVRATNKVGLVSEVGSSDGILIDTTPPPAPTVADDGAFTSSIDTLHATWTSVVSPSGIASYEYTIGTAAGLMDTKNWTDAGLVNEVTATGLALANGASYFINVRAISGVGKVGAVGSSNGIAVDTTPPTMPVVADGEAYSSSPTQLTAAWSTADPESGILLCEYAVGTTLGATDVRNWTPVGVQTSITIDSLALVDGGTYYISVRVTNGAGLISQVGTSDGIVVDLTPPSKPTVTDDGAYTTSGTQLHAVWSSSDAQSGIAKYEYAVGTTAGGTDTLAWTNAGVGPELDSGEKTITGLILASGAHYYISVRATNGAGLVSAVGTSDGILVDATPPTTPVVTDDGAYTQSTNTLHAAWTSADPETGITLYEYCIGTSAGGSNLVGWTGIGTATSVTRSDLALANGAAYFVSIRATNGIGLVSAVGSSDGITVDTTPPPAPTVTDDGAYTANASQLHATVACNDPESGVASYECAVGTTALGTDVVNWRAAGAGPDITITGLSLTTGVTYYISARATNRAGIVGGPGTSDGIKVDNTPPIMQSVTDDGDFTGSVNSLHGSWSATDPESGVVGYRYCIGTTPGSNNVAEWLDVGAATEHVRTGLSLANGQTYYITVIATSGAGASSSPMSSNGITADLTPPTTPVVTDTGVFWGYKTSLWASWTSGDPESGVVDCQVSVGTSSGATDVAAWKSLGAVTSYTVTGLHLSDGVTYYFNVKTRNGAGGWSAVGSSDGVVIDSTPPTTPIVIDDGDTTSVLDSLHATWHSEDPESGIVEYVYCVGTSPGATDVVGWTSAGHNEDVTVTGLIIDPVLRYYFSVKAKSGSGAWSATGASDGIGYTSGAAIWSRFRNDSRCMGRGLFNATRTNDLAWAIPTEGIVESSPAIAGDGTTYIGSYDGKLYAITQNGTIRWTADLGSPVSGSPTIADDGSILVGGFDGKVWCLSKSGEEQWSYATGGMIISSPLVIPPGIIPGGMTSPSAGSEGTVYVGSMNGSLYALDFATGAKNWSYATGGGVWSSPSVDDAGVVYIGSEDGALYAINPNGTRKWRYVTSSSILSAPAIGPDGVIYIGSGDGGFYAINPNGTRKWRFETYSPIDSSAAIGPDGTLYFGTGYDGGDGSLYALRPNGTEIWHIDLPGGGMSGSPAVDPSGTVYFGTSDKKVYAYSPDKTKLWEFATGDSVASSPALGADGSVIFGSYDGKVYCLRDTTSKDLTPPTTPVVTVPRAVIVIGDPFAASWSATDPDSMVAEYTYAIGTTAGGSDLAGWTSAGIETSINRDDLPLEAGRTYHVSVKARNPSQRWSDVGVSQGVTVVSSVGFGTIGGLKTYLDGAQASIESKTVTGVFADCFFIEESDRFAGIRCIPSHPELVEGLKAGDIVDVSGKIATVNGECVISEATHVYVGPDKPVKPVGVVGRSILRPIPDLIGLEVTLYGRVTAVDTGWFVIDDGSKLASPRGVLGVEVRCDGVPTVGGNPVTLGMHLAATGNLCRELVGTQPVTVLRLIPGKLIAFD